jgi:hypothetical protein
MWFCGVMGWGLPHTTPFAHKPFFAYYNSWIIIILLLLYYYYIIVILLLIYYNYIIIYIIYNMLIWFIRGAGRRKGQNERIGR